MPHTRLLLTGSLLLALLCLVLPARAGAPALVVLDDDQASHRAGLALDYFPDHAHACDLACAQARFAAGGAVRSNVTSPNLGIDGNWWFRLAVRNDTTEHDWVARIDMPYLDEVDMHVLRADGRRELARTGDWLPMSEHPLRSRVLGLPLYLAPGEQVDVLLRVHNAGPVNVPLLFETRYRFEKTVAQENLAFGLYFGVLIAVLLYNLLILAIVRDPSYLLYVLYVASFSLTMATVYGFSQLYFWPESPWWANRSVPLLVLVTGAIVLLFTRSFLRLAPGSPRDKVMLGALTAILLLLPVALLAPFGIAVRTIYIFATVVIVWLLWLGATELRAGNRAARYFLLAWIALLVMLAAFLLTKLGVLPSIAITEYGILFGSAAEAILLSIALAHRFALMREEGLKLQGQLNAELEQRVEARTRELDQALRARSEFLATISHEIRTPLNGVLGIAELMMDTKLDPRQREYAQIIQHSGRTLLAIINDVLDYSKIEAGKMTLERVPFRIHEVLNSATQIFRAEAERRKLRFVTEIDPDVPQEIMGDPVRLQQVLNNLLSNAVKFTEEGEVRLSVHREGGNRLMFVVADTGIGIASSVQGQLFEAFNQGDQSMTRRFGGTGLGLAITRRLVELMGGSVSFESDLGRGTTFYFTLPVEMFSSGTWRAVAAPDGSSGQRRVLVVDDNPINLQVAEGLLRRAGHTVETCTGGEDAVQRVIATPKRYDAVFMDCEMPGMDGFAATRAIRRWEEEHGRQRTPVIALTAHAFAEKIDACRRAGMDDHIAKPLNARVLEQTLARHTA